MYIYQLFFFANAKKRSRTSLVEGPISREGGVESRCLLGNTGSRKGPAPRPSPLAPSPMYSSQPVYVVVLPGSALNNNKETIT